MVDRRDVNHDRAHWTDYTTSNVMEILDSKIFYVITYQRKLGKGSD